MEKLKALRKDKKLTRAQLARLVHVTEGTIYNWENNKAKPTEGNLIKLAEVLEVGDSFFTLNG